MPISWAMKSCLRRWASSRRRRKSPSNFAPLKSASSPRLNRKIRSISEYVNSRSRRSATAGAAGGDEAGGGGGPVPPPRGGGGEEPGGGRPPVPAGGPAGGGGGGGGPG